MVMEFMEGETLDARIEHGALPLDQSLKFAVQIADALDRAHRDGVKVVDFGLVKSPTSAKLGPDDATIVA